MSIKINERENKRKWRKMRGKLNYNSCYSIIKELLLVHELWTWIFIHWNIYSFFYFTFFPYVCTCMVDADRYYAIWCSHHPEAPEGSNHILIFYVITTVLPQKKSKITHVIILNILISHGKIFSSNLWDILWLTNS